MKKFYTSVSLFVILFSAIHAQQFEPLGKGTRTNGEILSMEVDSITNYLYVGGYFESIDGIACNNIAMYDGTTWHDMAGGMKDGYISCIKIINGNVYAAGNFEN